MQNNNGHSSKLTAPQLMVSDYDEDLARAPAAAPEPAPESAPEPAPESAPVFAPAPAFVISPPTVFSPPSRFGPGCTFSISPPTLISPPLRFAPPRKFQFTDFDPSELPLLPQLSPNLLTDNLEDREIIESLTRAHATNAERHVDVDGRVAQYPNAAARRQESANHLTNAERHHDVDGRIAQTSHTARHEESMKRLSNAERHVDGDGMLAQASHSARREHSRKENVRPSPIPAVMTSTLTASMIASLTGTTSLTSTKGSPKRMKQELPTDDDIADMEVSRITSAFESKNKSPMTSSILKRPTASFAPVQSPPGKLQDVSDLSVPRLVPRRKELMFNNSFELPPMGFQPLREMSFEGSRHSGDECLATNGTRNLKHRRADRLYGESESDSAYSNGSSPDERGGPMLWKVEQSPSKEEDLNKILSSFHVVESSKEEPDDNSPSTSNNYSKKDSSRKSKD